MRVLTAVVGVPLILGVLYVGGWPWAVLVVFLGLLAQREVYGLLALTGARPARTGGLALGALLALHAFSPLVLPIAIVLLLGLFAWEPFRVNDAQPFQNLSATVFGAIYPTALFAFLIDLRLGVFLPWTPREGFYLTLTVFLLVWATDTFAYIAGRSFGKHPLAPAVSPKKTWEGAVGGAAGALLVAVGLKATLLAGVLSWPSVLVVALICGAVSQFGDLFESKLKRSVGAKDSGNMLPGHGGMLDRFDAMILAAPLVYLYLVLAY